MVRLTGIRTGSSRRKHLCYFSPSCLRVRSLLREPACECALGGLGAGPSSRTTRSVTSNHNPWKRHLSNRLVVSLALAWCRRLYS